MSFEKEREYRVKLALKNPKSGSWNCVTDDEKKLHDVFYLFFASFFNFLSNFNAKINVVTEAAPTNDLLTIFLLNTTIVRKLFHRDR